MSSEFTWAAVIVLQLWFVLESQHEWTFAECVRWPCEFAFIFVVVVVAYILYFHLFFQIFSPCNCLIVVEVCFFLKHNMWFVHERKLAHCIDNTDCQMIGVLNVDSTCFYQVSSTSVREHRSSSFCMCLFVHSDPWFLHGRSFFFFFFFVVVLVVLIFVLSRRECR